MNERQEIGEYCKAIAGYAKRRGIGVKKLVAEFPALGGRTTYFDMCAGKFEGYNLENHLANYRQVAQYVAEGAGNEERYALPAVEQIENALKGVMQTWGLDRVTFVDGESGTGKTTAAKMLCAKYGSRVMFVEATEVWADSPRAFLREILRAFGVLTLPASTLDALDRVLELQGVTRRCLIVDEAHHLGPRCLNVLKTLVNKSPGEFCLIGIPSMWAKLHKQAYTEARQLSTNRMSERVAVVLDERAVAAYLKNVFPDAGVRETNTAAKIIRPAATQHGNMAFVRDVCRLIDGDLTQEAVVSAVQQVAQRK